MRPARLPTSLLVVVPTVLAVSGVGPRDRLTWWISRIHDRQLEELPGRAGATSPEPRLA